MTDGKIYGPGMQEYCGYPYREGDQMITPDVARAQKEINRVLDLSTKKSISQMDTDWLSFSKTMEAHIAEMRKKYQISDNVEIAQLLPMGWSLGDALKYAYEVIRWIDDPLIMQRPNIKEQMKENLLKSAHCLQITFSKLSKS